MGASELESKLRQGTEWPVDVKNWKVEKGHDATGEEAIWVWVTLENPMESRRIRSQLREMIREKIADYEEADAHWVYVRFRGESEVEAE